MSLNNQPQTARRTWLPLAPFAIISILVIATGALRDYRFLPNIDTDGFQQQIDYVGGLLQTANFSAIFGDPLSVVHLGRLILVAPFLQIERMVGGIGSLFLLEVLLFPLLWSFRTKRRGWLGLILTAARLGTLFLPLAVSGRTVLVVLGMGYLLLGMMKHPFSFGFILFGSLVSLLSSAAVLFTLSVLLLVGNRKDNGRRYYIAKGVSFVLLALLFVPSLTAKADGFMTGAAGYQSAEIDNNPAVDVRPKETAVVAAAVRLLNRSTVIVSMGEGNKLRMAVYLAIAGAALGFVGWHLWKRQTHPLLIPLAILSTGILLEGLALWPILIPLIWAYTGQIGQEKKKPIRQLGYTTAQ